MPLRKEDVFFPALPDSSQMQPNENAPAEEGNQDNCQDISMNERRVEHERKIKQL